MIKKLSLSLLAIGLLQGTTLVQTPGKLLRGVSKKKNKKKITRRTSKLKKLSLLRVKKTKKRGLLSSKIRRKAFNKRSFARNYQDTAPIRNITDEIIQEVIQEGKAKNTSKELTNNELQKMMETMSKKIDEYAEEQKQNADIQKQQLHIQSQVLGCLIANQDKKILEDIKINLDKFCSGETSWLNKLLTELNESFKKNFSMGSELEQTDSENPEESLKEETQSEEGDDPQESQHSKDENHTDHQKDNTQDNQNHHSTNQKSSDDSTTPKEEENKRDEITKEENQDQKEQTKIIHVEENDNNITFAQDSLEEKISHTEEGESSEGQSLEGEGESLEGEGESLEGEGESFYGEESEEENALSGSALSEEGGESENEESSNGENSEVDHENNAKEDHQEEKNSHDNANSEEKKGEEILETGSEENSETEDAEESEESEESLHININEGTAKTNPDDQNTITFGKKNLENEDNNNPKGPNGGKTLKKPQKLLDSDDEAVEKNLLTDKVSLEEKTEESISQNRIVSHDILDDGQKNSLFPSMKDLGNLVGENSKTSEYSSNGESSESDGENDQEGSESDSNEDNEGSESDSQSSENSHHSRKEIVENTHKSSTMDNRQNNGDLSEKSESSAKSESEKSEKSDKSDKEKSESSVKSESDKSEKSEKSEKSDKSDKSEKSDKSDKEKSESSGKSESDKSEKSDKEKLESSEQLEKSSHSSRKNDQHNEIHDENENNNNTFQSLINSSTGNEKEIFDNIKNNHPEIFEKIQKILDGKGSRKDIEDILPDVDVQKVATQNVSLQIVLEQVLLKKNKEDLQKAIEKVLEKSLKKVFAEDKLNKTLKSIDKSIKDIKDNMVDDHFSQGSSSDSDFSQSSSQDSEFTFKSSDSSSSEDSSFRFSKENSDVSSTEKTDLEDDTSSVHSEEKVNDDEGSDKISDASSEEKDNKSDSESEKSQHSNKSKHTSEAHSEDKSSNSSKSEVVTSENESTEKQQDQWEDSSKNTSDVHSENNSDHEDQNSMTSEVLSQNQSIHHGESDSDSPNRENSDDAESLDNSQNQELTKDNNEGESQLLTFGQKKNNFDPKEGEMRRIKEERNRIFASLTQQTKQEEKVDIFQKIKEERKNIFDTFQELKNQEKTMENIKEENQDYSFSSEAKGNSLFQEERKKITEERKMIIDTFNAKNKTSKNSNRFNFFLKLHSPDLAVYFDLEGANKLDKEDLTKLDFLKKIIAQTEKLLELDSFYDYDPTMEIHHVLVKNLSDLRSLASKLEEEDYKTRLEKSKLRALNSYAINNPLPLYVGLDKAITDILNSSIQQYLINNVTLALNNLTYDVPFGQALASVSKIYYQLNIYASGTNPAELNRRRFMTILRNIARQVYYAQASFTTLSGVGCTIDDVYHAVEIAFKKIPSLTPAFDIITFVKNIPVSSVYPMDTDFNIPGSYIYDYIWSPTTSAPVPSLTSLTEANRVLVLQSVILSTARIMEAAIANASSMSLGIDMGKTGLNITPVSNTNFVQGTFGLTNTQEDPNVPGGKGSNITLETDAVYTAGPNGFLPSNPSQNIFPRTVRGPANSIYFGEEPINQVTPIPVGTYDGAGNPENTVQYNPLSLDTTTPLNVNLEQINNQPVPSTNGMLPINLEQVNAVDVPGTSGMVPINIQQILGNNVSNINPLPINLEMVNGTDHTVTNPVFISGGVAVTGGTINTIGNILGGTITNVTNVGTVANITTVGTVNNITTVNTVNTLTTITGGSVSISGGTITTITNPVAISGGTVDIGNIVAVNLTQVNEIDHSVNNPIYISGSITNTVDTNISGGSITISNANFTGSILDVRVIGLGGTGGTNGYLPIIPELVQVPGANGGPSAALPIGMYVEGATCAWNYIKTNETEAIATYNSGLNMIPYHAPAYNILTGGGSADNSRYNTTLNKMPEPGINPNSSLAEMNKYLVGVHGAANSLAFTVDGATATYLATTPQIS